MHRRGRARGHQRRDPPAAADAAARAFGEFRLGPCEFVRAGQQVQNRIPDGPRRAENRGIDAFAFAAHRIPHPHGQNVLRRIVRTLDHAPPDEQPHRGRVPRVLNVVVGHEMRLPRRKPFPERPVRLKRIVEFAAFRHDGPFRRRVPEVPQYLPPELLRLFPELRRPRQLHVAVGEPRQRVVRQADPVLLHPVAAHFAVRDRRHVLGVVLEDFRDAVLHFQRGRAPAVVNLPEARGEMVRSGLSAHKYSLTDIPSSRTRQHGGVGVAAGRIHEAHGVERAGRSGHHLLERHEHTAVRLAPRFGVGALEGEHAAIAAPAVDVPIDGVAQRQAAARVEADEGVHVVVIPVGGVQGL